MITRRDFLASTLAISCLRHIPLNLVGPAKPLKFAVITDLHHGLAPDAMMRLNAFADTVRNRKDLDVVIQMGDFCYSTAEAVECRDLFHSLPHTKLQVLGNHDMDKVDKDEAVRFFRMKSRYGSQVIKGYRFVWLDLNHFKKAGELHSYAKGNYFTDGASGNWADPEQLAWLKKELNHSKDPVILLSHQPLGFAEPGRALPPEQAEVMKIVHDAGNVAVCLFGHLHVDRLEQSESVPCLCVNSASYFWYNGMQPYAKPLFAFMEVGSNGVLKVEGVSGDFAKDPPAGSEKVIGRSASVSDRSISLLGH